MASAETLRFVSNSIIRILRATVPDRLQPRGYLTRLTQRRTGLLIANGPFAGMRYGRESYSSAYLPKLLGVYERDLQEAIEALCSLPKALIVDVGAAEGYYAVGMALRNPGIQVVAFELDVAARGALAKLATINDVAEQVAIYGSCAPSDLQKALTGRSPAVVICDVEGHERELMDPTVVPALQAAHLLIEVHEFLRRGLRDELVARFRSTHDLVHIHEQAHLLPPFPYQTTYTRLLPRRYTKRAVNEWRPEPMDWLWLTPRSSQ